MSKQSVSKNSSIRNHFQVTALMAVGLLMLGVLASNIFAWSGSSHSTLATILLNDPTVAPFISEFGVNANEVRSWTSEPPDAWHHPGWTMLNRRGYLGVDNGMDWTSLSETTRLRYLIHIAVDCGVPLGHSPANDKYDNQVAELQLEGQVATWDSYPSIVGQTWYQHSSTGYQCNFTGTYWDVLNKFYDACLNNALWYKGKENLVGLHSSDTNRTAGWAGTTMGLYLGRAMLVDYFLAKRDTVAVAGGSYGVNPGGTVTLSSAGSNDPDSVSWNTDGTYVNNGAGLSSIAWDLNGDGTYETAGGSPSLSYSILYDLLGPTEGRTIHLRVVDNEGKVGYATSSLAVYTPPVANGKAQRGWLGRTGDLPSAWTWDNLIDAGSYDPDGTAIVSYGWDLNNDGVIDKIGGSSIPVTYDDLSILGINADENHTVTLTVTDNEGVQSRQDSIACPVLVNPVCEVAEEFSLYGRDGSVTFWATGYDPDGGEITQWLWDLNNDGIYESQGQVLNLTYSELQALGVTGEVNTIRLKILDNDNSVTGEWQGQTIATSTLRIYPLTGDDANKNIYDYRIYGMNGEDWVSVSNGTWLDWATVTTSADKYRIDYNGWYGEGVGNGCMMARAWSARSYETITKIEFTYAYNANPGLFTPVVYTMGANETTLSPATPIIWQGTVYGWNEGRMSITFTEDQDIRKIALGLTVPKWGYYGYLVEFSDVVITTVKKTGDANLDNSVDVGDLGILAANYGALNKTWSQGDFNGDGVVDVGDLGILAANYGTDVKSAMNFEGTCAGASETTADDTNSSEEVSGFSMCSSLGLPLIVNLLLAGLMLVKPDK